MVTATTESWSDEQLWSEYLTNDCQFSLSLLYKRWQKRLAAFFRHKYQFRNSDIEEVVQSTWITLDRSKHAFQPGRAFAPWIYSLARLAAKTELRRLSRQRKFEKLASSFEVYCDRRSPEPSAVLEAREFSSCLRSVISSLPKAHLDLVADRFARGKSFVELAASAGISSQGIQQRVGKLLEYVRKRFVNQYERSYENSY
jgi:RNA polymerase sigma factor (sigma-70 family)